MQMFFEQTEQYAGNFARESTETITGSLGMLQASWSSLLAGLGNSNADITNLAGNVVESFRAVVKNIIPVLQGIVTAIPPVMTELVAGGQRVLPEILPVVAEVFSGVFEGILELLPEILPVMMALWNRS